VSAAVLLPAVFVMFCTHRLFFPVAHRVELFGGEAESVKELSSSFGTTISQRQVVFVRSALVTETFDSELIPGILLQNFTQSRGVSL
jgi:hypothetical protein